MKKLTLSMLLAVIASSEASSQIFTPSGTITGPSNNSNVQVGGTVTLSNPPTNKLIVNDNLSNGGIMKLVSDNGAPGDKWWLGFSHGTNTDDNMDRARIGVDILDGGAGRLFFTTGPAWGGQNTRMFIDEAGKIDMYGKAEIHDQTHIHGGTGIGIAPSSTRNLKINATNAALNIPFTDGAGLEVNSPVPGSINSASLLVGGGMRGLFAATRNPGGSTTAAEILTGEADHSVGMEVDCIMGTVDNIGIRVEGGGRTCGLGCNTQLGYGIHSTARGADKNIGIYGAAYPNDPLQESIAGQFKGHHIGTSKAKAGRFEGSVDIIETAASNNAEYGLFTQMTGNTIGTAKGIQVSASHGKETQGIDVSAINNTSFATFNYGVKSTASTDKAENYGVRSEAAFSGNNPALKNYGVYSIARHTAGSPNCTNIGIWAEIAGGVAPPPAINGNGSYAGYFKGLPGGVSAAFFNGSTITSGGGNYSISDLKFKENIKEFTGGLETIMKLSPKTYTFKGKDQFPSFNFYEGKQYGFIAQELEKVLPEAVQEAVNPVMHDHENKKIADAVSFKAVNYTALIPVLTAAIQEQQQMIAQRDAKINDLEERIKRLESSNGNTTGIDNKSTANSDMLYQNVPNPFGGTTEIHYKIHQSFTEASIMIFDMNGRKLKNLPVHGAEGQVTVSAAEMTPGMYLYSLILDGREVATKRMVVNK